MSEEEALPLCPAAFAQQAPFVDDYNAIINQPPQYLRPEPYSIAWEVAPIWAPLPAWRRAINWLFS